VNDTVAAKGRYTVVSTSIKVVLVAIIAFFATVRGDNSITTPVLLTDVAASISSIDLIPVVAGFITGFSRT